MKEKSTTKLQRCATGKWLSNVCKGLLLLGCVKLSLLIALIFGYPLPDIPFSLGTSDTSADASPHVPMQDERHDSANVLAQMMEAANLSDTAQHTDAAQLYDEAHSPVDQAHASPQGSAAVRAANEHTRKLEALLAQENARRLAQQTQHNSAQQPSVPTPQTLPMARKPVEEKPSWWGDLQNISSLPIPSLGLLQVAYAATLDAPPPPNVPAASASPFMPSQQGVAPQQPAPTDSILPAGTAGPQVGIVNHNPLVPNPNPPAPLLDNYVPPEDPLRKQQELARREQEILTLQRQMEQRLQELKAAEQKVKGMLDEAKQVEGDKVTALTDMYVNMKPRQAAAALENMDEAVAVKILASIPAKQAGEILSYANPEKTALFTEMLTRMQLQ